MDNTLQQLLESPIVFICLLIWIGDISLAKIVKAFKGERVISSGETPIEDRIEDLISEIDDIREELSDILLDSEREMLEGKLSDRLRVLNIYLENIKK